MYIFLATVILPVLRLISAQGQHTASACFGNGNNDCYNLILDACNAGERIELISQQYGYKEGRCPVKGKDCTDPNNGCCAFNTLDCIGEYTRLHAFNLHSTCSGKPKCQTVAVQNRLSCGRFSGYATIDYDCVPEALSFCSDKMLTRSFVDVIFDQSTPYSNKTECTCSVTSSDNIIVEYVDVRMFKAQNTLQGSECPSASLAISTTFVNTGCVSTLNEEDNFKYDEVNTTFSKNVELLLTNLYKTGPLDLPEFVWIKVSAENDADVTVKCARTVQTPTARPTTAESTSGGDPGNLKDGGINTGVAVAVVLVLLILIAAAGAFFYFYCYRRRGFRFGKKQAPKAALPGAVANANYSVDGEQEEEYAEIGFVPETSTSTPNYDPVYVPKGNSPNYDPVYVPNGPQYDQVYVPGARKSNEYVSPPSLENGGAHSFENSVDVNRPVQPKKSALGKIKQKKDKLFSYFKKQDNLSPNVTDHPRISNASSASYDHLHKIAHAKVEIRQPILQKSTNTGNHIYSHTGAIDLQNSHQDNKDVQSPANSPKNMEKEASAVELADAYIEFKLDPTAGDRLATFGVSSENIRPEPPSRPPPSPRLTPGSINEVSSNTSPILDTLEKMPKSNSLSPKQIQVEGNQLKYDYAKGSLTPSPRLSPRESVHLDENSPPMYDYADVSDNETNRNLDDSRDSTYEDVDAKLKAASLKLKQTAANTLSPHDSTEYLEPINKRSRSSSPRNLENSNALKENTHAGSVFTNKDSNVKFNIGNEVLDAKKKLQKPKDKTQKVQTAKQNETVVSTAKTAGSVLDELKVKNKEKRKPDSVEPKKGNVETKAGAIKGANKQKKSVVKSDNVNTKDYADVGELARAGGVSDMKKMFETRDGSESESSRQSSPRDAPTKINMGPSKLMLRKDVTKSISDA
ncbi:uncharacterized protein LOC128236893 isoform X2 [Mya arenaria]|uniref:uncharacterized protein LOC128236893 isoform X2 n=1 Tax=Mya arenaria TaxID=6604 RepID=UPI0022E672DA|nr:uncharacterized protein LOC128236893 isoform X2 [Mya arenaria]